MEFEDALDRNMLDRGMWEATAATFGDVDEKVKSKVFHAVSRSYWPVLDEVILMLGPEQLLRPGNSANELKNVEIFTQKWIQSAITRVWGVENAEQLFNQDTVTELFLRLVAPFGPDHPYSCIPKVLVETIGTPPPDWPYIEIGVQELFSEWGQPGGGSGSGESSKKRRKTSAQSDYGQVDVSAKARANGKQLYKPSAKTGAVAAKMPPGSIGRASKHGDSGQCEAGRGCGGCTSQEDCIGSPQSRLVQHLLAGEEGDIYCEPCWCTFVRRNPQLQGVFLE